jgi:hypothetical protein
MFVLLAECLGDEAVASIGLRRSAGFVPAGVRLFAFLEASVSGHYCLVSNLLRMRLGPGPGTLRHIRPSPNEISTGPKEAHRRLAAWVALSTGEPPPRKSNAVFTLC